MATVTLQHPTINSGNPVRVLCKKVTFSGKKNLYGKPNINGSSTFILPVPTEIQTQSAENVKIVLDGVYLTEEAGTLLWDDVMLMYLLKYDGTGAGTKSYLTLNVQTGSGIDIVGTQDDTNIKVIMESFTFPLDATDSKNAYLPVGTIVLTETA